MYTSERFNSISHLVGAAMAVVGASWLVVTAAQAGDPWRIVSFGVYGSMLVLLYGHRLRHGHGIWHLFVLAGSVCHFFTVLLFVA